MWKWKIIFTSFVSAESLSQATLKSHQKNHQKIQRILKVKIESLNSHSMNFLRVVFLPSRTTHHPRWFSLLLASHPCINIILTFSSSRESTHTHMMYNVWKCQMAWLLIGKVHCRIYFPSFDLFLEESARERKLTWAIFYNLFSFQTDQHLSAPVHEAIYNSSDCHNNRVVRRSFSQIHRRRTLVARTDRVVQ